MNHKLLESKITRPDIASLKEVMQYENPDVIERFRGSWDLTLEESEEIFNEMKKWLWICADNAKMRIVDPQTPNLAITSSLTLVDEMWHAFILFTKPYTAFCNKFFGFYIHHGPTTGLEKERIKKELEKDAEAYLKKVEQDLTIQYEYIYEKLGESTLQKWYSSWTDKFSSEYLNERYKKTW